RPGRCRAQSQGTCRLHRGPRCVCRVRGRAGRPRRGAPGGSERQAGGRGDAPGFDGALPRDHDLPFESWGRLSGARGSRGHGAVALSDRETPGCPFDPQVLNQKGSLFLTRPTIVHYIATRAELVARAGEVLGWIKSGKLKLRIERELPLAQAAEAHRLLEGRKTTGKVLLVP